MITALGLGGPRGVAVYPPVVALAAGSPQVGRTTPRTHFAMACPKCENIVETQNSPHVIRKCEGCGRELRMREPGKHGIGFEVRKGDQVVIPKGWLKLSLNPLKGGGRFTRYGLQWFAAMINLDDLPAKKGTMLAELTKLEERCDQILKPSPMLEGLDLENPDDAEQIMAKVKANPESLEWWALATGTFLSFARHGIEEKDIEETMWAVACAERCRSMMVFKEHLEEVIWIGHSAKRVVDLLRTWDGNKENGDEGFWQITLKENAYAIGQVFAVPVVFVKDAAYIGGMNINKENAKLVDYLFSMESSREAALVEIKTPVTKLLGRKYRNTYPVSPELAGAVAQALDYRETLVKNIGTLGQGSGQSLDAFVPRCVVIAGNGFKELDTAPKRRAFERYRANLKDVEVVTYDELFRKLEVLANLFSLTRAKKD